MQKSESRHGINIFFLIMLLSGGALLFGSTAVLADSDNRGDGKARWEQRERAHREDQNRFRREGAREVRKSAKQAAGKENGQTGRGGNRQAVGAPRSDQREVLRDLRRKIKHDAQREIRHDRQGARGPAVAKEHRSPVVRERTVIRNVSRPQFRNEVRDYRRPHKLHRPDVHPRHRPHREVVVKTLPRGSRTVIINRERFHIHNGRYYRHTPRGYLVVRPPLGTLVAELPFGFLRVSFGGLDYFVWDNVFYRHTPYGYRVVAAPNGYEETDYGPVRVETALLNIRTGPGRDYGVIGRLEQGTLLIVTAVSPGWYYVLLPNGEYGWIMSRHTSPLARG